MTITHVVIISAGVWGVLSVATLYGFMGIAALAKRSARRGRASK